MQAPAFIIIAVPVLAMLIGSCWLLSDMCKDIQNDIAILNNAKTKENPQNAIKHFRNFIRDFSAVKQLSVECNYEISVRLTLI